MQGNLFLKNSSSPHYLRKGNESNTEQDFIVEREAAIQKLSHLVNKDLRELADDYGITVFKNGQNKGWAGQVIERYLDAPISSSKKPDFGDWELKKISLWYDRKGELGVKYPMAITMVNEDEVRKSDFRNSSLLTKLRKMVIAATIWEGPYQEKAIFYGATIFDLDDHQQIYKQIESDYNLVRDKILNSKFSELNGYMGEYIQPKTKGKGRRAFYARATFLSEFIFPLLR